MSLNKDVKSVWKIIIKFLIYSLFGTILSSYFAPQYFIYFFGITSVWLIIPIAIADFSGKSLFIGINGTQYEKAFYIFKAENNY